MFGIQISIVGNPLGVGAAVAAGAIVTAAALMVAGGVVLSFLGWAAKQIKRKMGYVTKQQLIDAFGTQRLIDLTDRATPPAGAIDDTVLNKAIGDTDAMIDGFVGAKYELPLSETPPLLTQLAQAIAFYLLHIDTVSDKAKADYDEARKTLKWISSGEVKLNIGGAEPDVAVGNVTITAADRVDISDFSG